MRSTGSPDSAGPSWGEWVLAIVVGCALSGFQWRDLIAGGGLVGGDTYPYFFPQKQLMAEEFAAGRLPLWHDRTSLGYPLHAESQSGLFYPSNQVLYRLFDVNTAYNLSIIGHYALAFVAGWRLARSQGVSAWSSMFAAAVYVYGWFPVRVSLEWSIIGGLWFPVCLWQTDCLVRRWSARRVVILAVCFAVHLLAGHFTLAFITQLTCLGYSVLAGRSRRITAREVPGPQLPGTHAAESRKLSALSAADGRQGSITRISLAPAAWTAGAIGLGLLLASIQLVPTFELRRLSQRDGSSRVFDPAYGHMPPIYLTQLVASWWFWHTEDLVATREMQKYPLLMSSADTNQVEAHLYVGLIPLSLLGGLVSFRVRDRLRSTHWKIWLLLSAGGILYSFGWLVPLFKSLPGFGFFMGPGRYTIMAAFGLPLVAALVLDDLLRRRSVVVRCLVAGALMIVTLADVLQSSRYPVCDAVIVPVPPLRGLNSSWVARKLREADQQQPVRLVCGGPNVGNLFSVSTVPQYLGLGPAEYFSEDAGVLTQPQSTNDMFPSDEQLQQWYRLSVTHVLTTESVTRPHAEMTLVASAPDAFLNRVWARGTDLCYLYELKHTPGRLTASEPQVLSEAAFLTREPACVEFACTLSEAASVTLNELMFPGWSVAVDGQPAAPEQDSGFGRRVRLEPGKHHVRWTYEPQSFSLGLALTCASLIVALGLSFSSRLQSFSRNP